MLRRLVSDDFPSFSSRTSPSEICVLSFDPFCYLLHACPNQVAAMHHQLASLFWVVTKENFTSSLSLSCVSPSFPPSSSRRRALPSLGLSLRHFYRVSISISLFVPSRLGLCILLKRSRPQFEKKFNAHRCAFPIHLHS